VSEDHRGDTERKWDDPPDGERGDAGDHRPQAELVGGCCGGCRRRACGGGRVLRYCHGFSLRADAWCLV
jgi:hypothetical protein